MDLKVDYAFKQLFDSGKNKDITVEVYNIANGDFKTYTVDFAASKLDEIDVKTNLLDENNKELVKAPYNNEEGIVAALTANPTGATLNVADIKFDVKPGKHVAFK